MAFESKAVLTNISRFSASASFVAPASEKRINIAVVNALSQKLSVEVRREGRFSGKTTSMAFRKPAY